MKTYEARSRIGLKLKIKQEAGLSKVIHNTALDPPGIPAGLPPPASQLNGSLEKKPPPPAAQPCRLPLRKTYRESRDFIGRDSRDFHRDFPREPGREARGSPERREAPRSERRPVITALRREPAPPRLRGKGPPEEPSDGEEEEDEEGAAGGGAGLEPPWAGKRRRAEALEVDNASFSSDSPQDDSLSEHLQSAIDSILNLQQPRNPAGTAGGSAGAASGGPAGSGSGSPFPGPPRRAEPLLPPPSHNGGLGAARTCTR